VFLIGFPLLIIPLAIYNMVVFLTPGVRWADKVATVRLPSQADWTITFGDVLIGIALFLLFIEALKAARIGGKTMMDHGLSVVLFVIALLEFLMVGEAATSVFAMLTVICLVEIIIGMAVARRGGTRRETVEPQGARVPAVENRALGVGKIENSEPFPRSQTPDH
jgi:hypothetical protein